MLFILTGDVQIGKTRWLIRLIEELAQRNIPSWGVVAPGVWGEEQAADPALRAGGATQSPACKQAAQLSESEHASHEVIREKLGIDNVLLPAGHRIAFAKRHDLARADGMYGQHNESAKARLAWSITDEALAQVNAHFEDIACTATNQGDHTEPGLLVVDEFGRLELQHDGGLTQAVRLIEQGPTERWPHALIVVREWLIDSARERFDAPWGATLIIGPDDKSREAVLTAFGQRA